MDINEAEEEVLVTTTRWEDARKGINSTQSTCVTVALIGVVKHLTENRNRVHMRSLCPSSACGSITNLVMTLMGNPSSLNTFGHRFPRFNARYELATDLLHPIV